MRTARRLTAIGTGAALVVASVIMLASTGPAANAAPTPIYNAPPGGGPVEEVVLKVGPFQLDALGGAHDQDEGEGLVPRPDGAFGLKAASFDLVDENDQPIGRHDVHMHHFVIGGINQIDTACPDHKVAGIYVQPLIGSGMERTPILFPDPYVLPVKADDGWGAVWHLMNMTNQPRTVYVQYKLTIQRGADATNSRFLTPYWADARTCPAGVTWDVPGNGGPNGVEVHTKQWAMPFDGYVVGIGGHMHDGGISMTTAHEDGTVMCQNVASYYQGMLDAITPCATHDSVRAGELLSVTSRYDNSVPHQDVMGMSVMFLWQGDQGVPPSSTTTTAAVQGISTSPTATPVAAVPRFTG